MQTFFIDRRKNSTQLTGYANGGIGGACVNHDYGQIGTCHAALNPPQSGPSSCLITGDFTVAVQARKALWREQKERRRSCC